MKHPGMFIWLFGNMVSWLLALLALAFACYKAWYGDASWWLAILALALLGLADRSRTRLEHYRKWKRQWDSVSGDAAPSVASRLRPIFRILIGIALWLIGFFAVAGMAREPNGKWLALAFVLLTVLIVLNLIFRLIRHFWHWSHRSATSNVPVKICVSIPRNSIGITETWELPGYCQRVLKARDGA